MGSTAFCYFIYAMVGNGGSLCMFAQNGKANPHIGLSLFLDPNIYIYVYIYIYINISLSLSTSFGCFKSSRELTVILLFKNGTSVPPGCNFGRDEERTRSITIERP